MDGGSFTLLAEKKLKLSVPRRRSQEAAKRPVPPEPWRGSGIPPAPWRARLGADRDLSNLLEEQPGCPSPQHPPHPFSQAATTLGWRWGYLKQLWGSGALGRVRERGWTKNGVLYKSTDAAGEGPSSDMEGLHPKNPQRSPPFWQALPCLQTFELLGLFCFSKWHALLLFFNRVRNLVCLVLCAVRVCKHWQTARFLCFTPHPPEYLLLLLLFLNRRCKKMFIK